MAEDRAEFRRPELFPPDTRLIEVDRDYSGDFLAEWRSRELFIAVVSRCWETDLAATAAVLREATPGLRYLGLMGSRRKIERVTRELEERQLSLEGVPWHAPIGLQIGGSTPAEIAVSIVAELVLERRRGQQDGAAAASAVRLV